MEIPNYVLKANEGILVPKSEKPLLGKLKITVWIVVGVIIIGSILFQDNLFNDLSWSSRILLIAMVIGIGFSGGNKRVPSPFEIQFYNDYLIVYREKRYYNKKVIRKEYNKFFYKDIYKIEYRTGTKQILIKGIIEGIWYNYKKDGTLPEKPTYHRTTDGGICYFYTTEAPDVDFVYEIENHSPIKVAIVE
jgi:hypothetical protein